MQSAALVFTAFPPLRRRKNISLSELATTGMVDRLCNKALIITEMPLAITEDEADGIDAHHQCEILPHNAW